MTQAWTQSRKGHLIDILNPTPQDIDFREMADTLAHSYRYAGNFEKPISLGQHTLIVLDATLASGRTAPAPYALLHDGHEYVIGDITSPVESAINSILKTWNCTARPIETLKGRLDHAIFSAAGLCMPSMSIRDEIRRCDLIALATERRDFLAKPDRAWPFEPPYPPLRKVYRTRAPYDVADELFEQFKTWLPALNRSAMQKEVNA